jgi:hypothetical protein
MIEIERAKEYTLPKSFNNKGKYIIKAIIIGEL